MKDSEFLELLNLYVDHEITKDGAARLEAEVSVSPARRKLYRQYCLMEKGCSLLTGAFADPAAVPALRPRGVDREARSFWGWSGVFAAGGLAAAACIAAVVSVHRRSAPAPLAPSVAAVSSARPTAAVALADSGDLSVAMAAPRPSSFPSPFGGGQLQTAFNTHAWANPGSVSAQSANDPLAWIDQVKLTPGSHPGTLIPIQIKDSALLLPLDANAAPLNLGPSEPTEVTAFEFQSK